MCRCGRTSPLLGHPLVTPADQMSQRGGPPAGPPALHVPIAGTRFRAHRTTLGATRPANVKFVTVSEIAAGYRTTRERLSELVRALSDEEVRRPVPACPAWDVH